MTYTGRFAPSPTGLLHLGSLVAAIGSYLDARTNKGVWLLRIEDIDPPREMLGAKDLIPKQLEAHGLFWDHSITYQSERLALYADYLEMLRNVDMTYLCNCSRQRVKSLGSVYDGHCRNRENISELDAALRVKLDTPVSWQDLIQGPQLFSPKQLNGDFIVKRRDGLVSYQLAVAVDDAMQGITHVIRGADLLDSTARQMHLHQLLKLKSPEYGHLPVVNNQQGQKLSKQTYASELDTNKASENLVIALRLLGQNPDAGLLESTPEKILSWATSNWKRSAIPRHIPNLEDELC